MDNKKWFKEAKFGMMIHWGIYSLLGGEYNGKRMPHIGEWAQSYFQIPNKEYHALAKIFNPVYFDADSYAKLAKDAGMKYMVFTSKHHDGFAMFKSEVSKFNICDASPFGRDVVSELAESCYKYGLKFGLYYSQELDWSEPNGGGYTAKHKNCDCMWWTNHWDFPDNDKKDYSICFKEKIKPQVTELLTKYGDLCLIWFDTPHTISKEQSTELYNLVKKYQPDCLVNSRIGNGMGDYTSAGDNQILDDYKGNLLFETPATINDTWGYKTFDQNWKSAKKIIELKNHLNERGINYLLNVGPDYLGRIPAPSVDVLREAGKSL